MKLHLACGDVYLKGYENIDCYQTTFNKPKGTTLKDYYKGKKIGVRGQVYIDHRLDLTDDQWGDNFENQCDEIVMICAIEHFTLEEAQQIIETIKKCLIPGGRLLIDFPDLVKSKTARLIYGSSDNPHKWGYTKKTFKELLANGWKSIKFKEIVKHDYPMIGVEAIKL